MTDRAGCGIVPDVDGTSEFGVRRIRRSTGTGVYGKSNGTVYIEVGAYLADTGAGTGNAGASHLSDLTRVRDIDVGGFKSERTGSDRTRLPTHDGEGA